MVEKKPAHEVILSKLDELSKRFSGASKNWVRIRLFEKIIILCDVLNEMIIPEKEIANCQKKFEDINKKLKDMEFELAIRGIVIQCNPLRL